VRSGRDKAKRVAGASGLLVLLRRLARRDLDDERPKAVVSDPETDALADHAHRLAAAGREDQGAVIELRAAARGRRQRMEQAAAVVRFRLPVAESRVADRANRLLRAAAEGAPVEPLSTAQDAWFRELESFADVPRAAGFAFARGGRRAGSVMITGSW